MPHQPPSSSDHQSIPPAPPSSKLSSASARQQVLDEYLKHREKFIDHLEHRWSKFRKEYSEFHAKAKRQRNQVKQPKSPAPAAAATAGKAQKGENKASAVASSSRQPLRAVSVPPLQHQPFSSTASVQSVYKKPPSKKYKVKQQAKKNRKNKAPPTVPDVLLTPKDALALLRALEIGNARNTYTATFCTRPLVAQEKSYTGKQGDEINRRKSQTLRGRVVLPRDPKSSSEGGRVLVFAEDVESIRVAKEEGCAYVGGTELFQQLLDGEISPSKVLSTTEFLGQLSGMQRFLGQKGLFPTARRGTVGDGEELRGRIREAKDAVDWITDSMGKIKLPIGKVGWPIALVEENIKAVALSIREQYNAQYGIKVDVDEDIAAALKTKKTNNIPAIFWVQLNSSFGPALLLADYY